jgi:mono/diheme cytochrome c family protein
VPTRALVLAAFALALGGCGGGGDDGGGEAVPNGGTAPATSEDGGGGGGSTGQGNAKLGVLIWHEQGCVNCHELADAGIGATGRAGVVGPNLDEAKPSYDLVVERVTNGKGEMPSFSEQLLPSEIQDVAAYVSSVAGK